MSDTFRALCAALEQIKRHAPIMGSTGDYRQGQIDILEKVSAIARAALAQSTPSAPTDEQLYEIADEFSGEPVAAMRRALELWGQRRGAAPVPEAEGPTDEEIDALESSMWATAGAVISGHIDQEFNYRAFARAILSRWGRPAVAQPEGEVPTDEALLRTYGEARRAYCYDGPIDDWPKRAEREATVCGLRAVLARWGRPAVAPVPEAELPPRPPLATAVERLDLVRYGVTWDGSPDKPLLTPKLDGYWTPWHIAARLPQPVPVSSRDRPTAEELENMAKMFGLVVNDLAALSWLVVTCLAAYGDTPEPVPVSERLPEAEAGDLDRQGTCWMFHPGNFHYCLCRPDPSVHSHWLPHWALPLPSTPAAGEVQP